MPSPLKILNGTEKKSFLLNDEFYSMPHLKEFFSKYDKYFDNWNKGIIDKRAEELDENSYNKVWKFLCSYI